MLHAILALLSLAICRLAATQEHSASHPSPLIETPLEKQWTLTSSNGLLAFSIVDEVSKHVNVAGFKNVQARVWNGSFTPPVMKVWPGDTIKINFLNRLPKGQPTNVHFHGMRVSPKVSSDNVLYEIEPGETFQISVYIPLNHPRGLFWYHSHAHTFVEEQIMNGMRGLIVVQGSTNQFPTLANVTENLLGLTDFYFEKKARRRGKRILPRSGNSMNSNGPTHRVVSGIMKPYIYMRPGEARNETFGAKGTDALGFYGNRRNSFPSQTYPRTLCTTYHVLTARPCTFWLVTAARRTK